jgi:hypothetical protein
MPSLSVVTHCSNPVTMDFPFVEVINSVLPIADEVVIINGDPASEDDGEVLTLIKESLHSGKLENFRSEIKIISMPWQEKARKNASMIQRSNAIFQATGDYVLLLDGDEVLHEKDYDKILDAVNLGELAYTFRVNHFYRDYLHLACSSWWYKRRPYLFRNFEGIFDGYRSWLEEGKIVTNYTSDLVTWDYKPLLDYAKHTSIEVFHYGYVRDPEKMLLKQNNIEKRHHPDFDEIKEWEWKMEQTRKIDSINVHPNIMESRIENHMNKYPNYYKEF